MIIKLLLCCSVVCSKTLLEAPVWMQILLYQKGHFGDEGGKQQVPTGGLMKEIFKNIQTRSTRLGDSRDPLTLFSPVTRVYDGVDVIQ